MQEIKFYRSPLKAIKLLLLSLPFIIMGIITLNFILLGFFGLAIPVSLFYLLDYRPQIIISETGIFDRMAYKDIVNWELIHDAYPVNFSGQSFICLVLDEKAIPLLKGNKKIWNLSKAMGFQEVNLSLGSLSNKDQQKVEWLVTKLMRAEIDQRKDLIITSIANR